MSEPLALRGKALNLPQSTALNRAGPSPAARPGVPPNGNLPLTPEASVAVGGGAIVHRFFDAQQADPHADAQALTEMRDGILAQIDHDDDGEAALDALTQMRAGGALPIDDPACEGLAARLREHIDCCRSLLEFVPVAALGAHAA